MTLETQMTFIQNLPDIGMFMVITHHEHACFYALVGVPPGHSLHGKRWSEFPLYKERPDKRGYWSEAFCYAGRFPNKVLSNLVAGIDWSQFWFFGSYYTYGSLDGWANLTENVARDLHALAESGYFTPRR